MKRLLLILILFVSQAFAAEVTLQWDANTEPDLAGYKVHYGTASRTYATPVDVGNVTEHTLTLPDDIMHFFAVTAYDTGTLESAYSNEVSCINDVPPGTTIIINVNCGGGN